MAKEKINPILPNYVGKEILSFQEAVKYLDISESSLYKMTSDSKITFYKPNGGKLYFKKSDLDNFMLQNENKSVAEQQEDLISKIYENGSKK